MDIGPVEIYHVAATATQHSTPVSWQHATQEAESLRGQSFEYSRGMYEWVAKGAIAQELCWAQ